MTEKTAVRPFFSIGVTTYNRHDLLRETLSTIISQSFGDFEVIVGNDYMEEVLTGELLGISDPRVRIINHSRNLGEVGNMNALLDAANGRYFTWLFDDDLFEPGYLTAASEILERERFPSALFPGHKVLRGGASYQPSKVVIGDVLRFNGREFLRQYFCGSVKIISTSGFFDRELLKETIGGVQELCNSAIGLYCEYLFLAQCANLPDVVCVDAPFVVFRAHPESWGESNTELHKYVQGGERLVRQSAKIFGQTHLRQNFDQNLLGICKIHLATFCFAVARAELTTKKSISTIFRASAAVFKEFLRIRKIYLDEGGSTRLRSQFAVGHVFAKCLYLVGFSFIYYAWKWRAGKRNSTGTEKGQRC